MKAVSHGFRATRVHLAEDEAINGPAPIASWEWSLIEHQQRQPEWAVKAEMESRLRRYFERKGEHAHR